MTMGFYGLLPFRQGEQAFTGLKGAAGIPEEDMRNIIMVDRIYIARTVWDKKRKLYGIFLINL